MKAMVLAAGLGTRLLPYTNHRPKPLFPVLGKPLLLQTIKALQAAGFTEIAVNCHHLAEQIEHMLAGMPGVTVFPEDIVLGTGGGLRNARPWFGAEPVLVVNGDIYHTIDYRMVYENHLEHDRPVTLVMHDFPRFNKVALGGDSTILDFTPCPEAVTLRAFTGIHVLDPTVLDIIPEATFYDILDCYRYWLKQGRRIAALEVTGHFWSDMGTPADYLALHERLLTDPAFSTDSPFCLAGDLVLSRVELHHWASIGAGARIGQGASLTRVVVWDDAEVEPGSSLVDTIVI